MDQEELRALEADSILKNPLVNDAFEKIKNKLVDQIEVCPWDNDQHRDKLMLSLQLLKGLKKEFEDIITTGKLGAWLEKQPTPE